MCPPDRRSQVFAADRKALEEALQLAPVGAQRRVQYIGQCRFAGLRQNKCKRRRTHDVATAGPLQHAAARRTDQFARCLLVEHVERRGHAGFERKARQHVLAKGMDGEDFQAARRLQRLGEQPPRLLHVLRPAEIGTDLLNFPLQFLVRKHRPFAELLEQATLHLRRRRLRVGQAQDVRRLGVRQKQPRHAVGERVGLASAGIGGDPGGTLGVGSDDGWFERAHSSGASQPPIDHSRTRAR